MKITFAVPAGFNLKSTVLSHGWRELPPFFVDEKSFALIRLIELSSGKIISTRITERKTKSRVALLITANVSLTPVEQKEVKSQVKACLRLDEDFTEFYHEAGRYKDFAWIPAIGAGRMLRSPTVFEDVVKMICTTNCSWALTEIMTNNLCKKLGRELNGSGSYESGYSFPHPGAIADTTEKFLRKEIRAGYRSPYLLELSKRLVKKEIDIESWRSNTMPVDEFFKQVRSVKGVGPYAAGNLLKLLGRYDYLAIDSWCRKHFFEKHRNGNKVSDKTIENFYARFGKWQGLFFWMDLTKHWYLEQFTL